MTAGTTDASAESTTSAAAPATTTATTTTTTTTASATSAYTFTSTSGYTHTHTVPPTQPFAFSTIGTFPLTNDPSVHLVANPPTEHNQPSA